EAVGAGEGEELSRRRGGGGRGRGGSARRRGSAGLGRGCLRGDRCSRQGDGSDERRAPSVRATNRLVRTCLAQRSLRPTELAGGLAPRAALRTSWLRFAPGG